MIESSLAKAILTSRNEFSVSLHISAVRALVSMHSPLTKVRYNSIAAFEHRGVIPPIIRSLLINSCNTLPGKTRSGQWAIKTSAASPAC